MQPTQPVLDNEKNGNDTTFHLPEPGMTINHGKTVLGTLPCHRGSRMKLKIQDYQLRTSLEIGEKSEEARPILQVQLRRRYHHGITSRTSLDSPRPQQE